jgi:polygalacturonase
MRKLFISSLILTLCCIASLKAVTNPWSKAGEIVKGISKVHFPDRTVSITEFGAVANNPNRLAHEAINRAILTICQLGGGTVLIPDSTYYTGPITLKSNVRLHLSDHALLKFSTDINLYFPAVPTRWEGIDCNNTHPLIYAYGEMNIALTGRGTLDAQPSKEAWWDRVLIERGNRKLNRRIQIHRKSRIT